jgi:hypothetical protein
MNNQEKLAQIRLQQTAFIEAQTALDVSLRELEASLNKLLKDQLKKHKLEKDLYILLCFQGGCHTNKWDPFYHIYHIRADVYGRTGWVYVDGKWVYSTEPGAGKTYLHHLDFKKQLDSRIMNSLEAFRAELEEESGLRVNLGERKIVTKGDVKVPKSEDDLLTVHDGGSIMASGQKMHMGWDIGDPWAVVRSRKGHLVVYYSTNGHGFGYDHCVMPEQSVDDFIRWMEGDISESLKKTLKESRE